MIVVRLCGGMANQLFQYAMGRACAARLGASLGLDVTPFHKDKMRRYSLELWRGICAPVVHPEGRQIIKERGLPYNPGLLNQVTQNCILDGYWQSEKYFSGLRPLLAEELVPRQPWTDRGLALLEQIEEAGERSCFLTVRRTDYVTSSFHGLLGLDYYEAAIAHLRAQGVDPVLFVFSDEPTWCKEHLHLSAPIVVAGNYSQTTPDKLGREDQELMLMRACRHAICANSSYSWWGAWLGADIAGGVVVAPATWFLSTKEDPRDIVPSRWARF